MDCSVSDRGELWLLFFDFTDVSQSEFRSSRTIIVWRNPRHLRVRLRHEDASRSIPMSRVRDMRMSPGLREISLVSYINTSLFVNHAVSDLRIWWDTCAKVTKRLRFIRRPEYTRTWQLLVSAWVLAQDQVSGQNTSPKRCSFSLMK